MRGRGYDLHFQASFTNVDLVVRVLASLVSDLPRLCTRESERIVLLNRSRWIWNCSIADAVRFISSERGTGAKGTNLLAKISMLSKAARALKKE